MEILFTNGDHMTASKLSKLQQHSHREKPLIVATCEVKAKNLLNERTYEDYLIPDYEPHPVNLLNTDLGIAVYTHSSISKSGTQMKMDINFEEACLLEMNSTL